MTTQVMVLKIKEGKNSNFYEKYRADLFDDAEMAKLTDLMASVVRIGYDIKVELQEMEGLK